jgi:general stress protein CsbA
VNVAIALGVSLLFASYGISTTASYAVGFVTTGLFYLVVGGIVAMAMKNRLTQHNPAPTRTINELRKDKQWLTKEL